jgi:hypothetical protein
MPAITKAPSATQVYIMIVVGIASMLIALLLLSYSTGKQIKHTSTGRSVVSFRRNIVGDSATNARQVPVEIPYKNEQILFHNNPEFFLWLAFLSLLVAVASSLAPVLYLSVKDIFRNFSFTTALKAKLVVLTAGILFLIMVINSSNPFLITPVEVIDDFKILLSSSLVVKGIVVYTLLIAMIAVYGQLVVNHAISQLPATLTGLTAEQVRQKGYHLKFILLRQKLKLFLVCLATLIVFAVINTELVRSAILREVKTNIDIMPHNFVYIYGLVFTFFLAVLYLPIYYRLRQKGVSMLQLEDEQDEIKEPVFKAFIIKETPLDSLKIALSILAPILTTLIPGMKIF